MHLDLVDLDVDNTDWRAIAKRLQRHEEMRREQLQRYAIENAIKERQAIEGMASAATRQAARP
jgi:hypothetical protein